MFLKEDSTMEWVCTLRKCDVRVEMKERLAVLVDHEKHGVIHEEEELSCNSRFIAVHASFFINLTINLNYIIAHKTTLDISRRYLYPKVRSITHSVNFDPICSIYTCIHYTCIHCTWLTAVQLLVPEQASSDDRRLQEQAHRGLPPSELLPWPQTQPQR